MGPASRDVTTMGATRKRKKVITKKLAKRTKKNLDRSIKGVAVDLQRIMALRATPPRDWVVDMQERFDKSTDPSERMGLASQITYERLRRAHIEGRI